MHVTTEQVCQTYVGEGEPMHGYMNSFGRTYVYIHALAAPVAASIRMYQYLGTNSERLRYTTHNGTMLDNLKINRYVLRQLILEIRSLAETWLRAICLGVGLPVGASNDELDALCRLKSRVTTRIYRS